MMRCWTGRCCRAAGAFPFKAQPLTLCAYEVECDDVLDLTDQEILTAHGIAPSDLGCAWKDLETRGIRPPSWILAERLMRDGIAGVVVPSYASGATAADINVVFWNRDSGPPHQVRVIDEEHRLPKDASSWR